MVVQPLRTENQGSKKKRRVSEPSDKKTRDANSIITKKAKAAIPGSRSMGSVVGGDKKDE